MDPNFSPWRPGAAAEIGEKDKLKKYGHLQDRFCFVVVAQETSGVWGEQGLNLIKQIGRKISEVTKEPKRLPTYCNDSASVYRGETLPQV